MFRKHPSLAAPVLFVALVALSALVTGWILRSCTPRSERPRILVSTDIGGTDEDDNQSMLHLLMYSDRFDIEGLVSTASYGPGSKEEILRMIDLYEQDYPVLRSHSRDFPSPERLRDLTFQGVRGEAPLAGYGTPTEGSKRIVECARRKDSRPLWVLVWGCLEDVAQALHDAPDIADRIRVYWIGGPNKKWGSNGYAYIVEHFPDLWIIENNAAYAGFIGRRDDPGKYQMGFFDACLRGAGACGDEVTRYSKGIVKMGDTPSILYLMTGDPENPLEDHWGGRFEPMDISPKFLVTGPLSVRDTVPVYALMEWHLRGPVVDVPVDSVCLTMRVADQDWRGYHVGGGEYVVRYAPKAAATLHYTITSPIPGFPEQEGDYVVAPEWPGVSMAGGWKYGVSGENIMPVPLPVGKHWYTDLYSGRGTDPDFHYLRTPMETVGKWREEVLRDWESRLEWFK
ncbi:MAG: DUF1593 domain-containing protein [Bacteroidales bacterium]|nr:DUF1593 domain-containing protein [Bacteroidales bacterium]